MKKYFSFFLVCFFIMGCGQGSKVQQTNPNNNKTTNSTDFSGGKEKDNRILKTLTLSQLHHKYPTDFIFSGPKNKHEVALSFDDVPDTRFTPEVLDILKKYGVKATFFSIGDSAKKHPELIKQIVLEGHEIGNHSFTHPNFPKINDVQFHEEVQQTEKVLSSIIGYNPKLFRPPYGDINEAQIKWLVSQGYKIVNWDLDSLDWKGLNANQIKVNVLVKAHAGSIILLHAGGGKGDNIKESVKALPDIIQNLKSKGFKLVTVSDLLSIPTKK